MTKAPLLTTVAGIDPRNVKPNTAGALFLVGPLPDSENAEPLPGAPVYKTIFLRVRVVMGQVNVEDVKKVADFVAYLRSNSVPFITFSAGRDTPYPEYPEDLGEALATSPRLPGTSAH